MINSSISIVIPVYNVEKFVNETLLSIKSQSSQPDEVIIIDDGSTDNSFNIVNNFRNLQGWQILQTKNQGLGFTRNFGKSIAKSEYIFFLDSDDLIENNFIYEMKKIIQLYNKPDMILFSGKTFSQDELVHKKLNLNFTIEGQFYRGDKLLSKLVNRRETLPQASRYLTKKELWKKNNLNYPEGIAEDESVFFPLISLSENTVIKKNSYYKYRVNRPGSITMEPAKPKHADDYLNRILFTMNFMNLKKDLINLDYSAWFYNLEKKCLKYINLCFKSKKEVSWQTIIKVFFKTKNLYFLLKIFWRILKNIFKS